VDEVTFEEIEKGGPYRVVGGLEEGSDREDLSPAPVRRVMIPKPGAVNARSASHSSDRSQAGAGTDLRGRLRGLRLRLPPRRSGVGAVKEVQRLIRQGYTDVVGTRSY
jgi:hypothetical protein